MKKFFYGIFFLLISVCSAYTLAQETWLTKQMSGLTKQKTDMQWQHYVPGEIIVKFKPTKINMKSSAAMSTMNTFATNRGMEVKDKISSDNIAVFKIDKNQDFNQRLSELQTDPSVEYAQPNYMYTLMATSFNDTNSGNLRALPKIHRYEAYDMFSGNVNTTGTIVAVIDAWVAYDHPDLAANLWDGSSCKDENGNSLWGCMHGYDYYDDDKDPYPVASYHGTHVAGTIAAEANNNKGVIGINPHAKIMAIRVGNSMLSTDAIIKWISFAKNNWARIINASFGGSSYDTAMYDAINSFRSAGWLFIAAAGNDGANNDTTPTYPCSYTLDNIICVAASDQSDALASFSNSWVVSVDVWAPGVSIYSTMATINSTTLYSENFTSTATWSLPSWWSQAWTNANGWVLDSRIPAYGNALYGDMRNPYPNNVTGRMEKSSNASSTSWMNITFWTQCDTQYDTGARVDYMQLEISSDGSNFDIVDRWDEAYLDNDTNSWNNIWWATSGNMNYDITKQYATANFKIRFTWVSDTWDNNYSWCLVDNLVITKYTSPSTATEPYGDLQWTSMATPHVAGLASLAWSARPNLSYAQIKNVILNSGDAIGSLAGKTVSGKRINAQNVLLALGYTQPYTWIDWSQIYTAIGVLLSWQWIHNNLHSVTTGNASSFSWLYFAKMSWSDELGRITFFTGLDLTDTGTQNFLSGTLPSSLWISQWQIRFTPWSGFVGKNATLQMNLPINFSWVLSAINSWSFAVRDGSGGVSTGNNIITAVRTWVCTSTCPIYLDVAHFTSFDLRPQLLQVNIRSDNTWTTSYAKSWTLVTLSFTGSEALTWVIVTINGLTGTNTWWWVGRQSTFLVTWSTAETGLVFSIVYQDLNNNTGASVTTTTEWSTVKVDRTWPSFTVTSPATATGSTITIGWTGSDANGVAAIYINWLQAVGTGTRSKTGVALIWWTNTINISGTDLAGNIRTWTFIVTRLPLVASISAEVLSGTSVRITFTSDILASWYILYGTSSLNTTKTGTLTTWHNIVLNGLSDNATYAYKVYAMINGLTGDISTTWTFTTPKVIDASNVLWTTVVSWEVQVWWARGTGIVFSTTWTLTINNTWNTNNHFQINVSGFAIQTLGGTRDGILHPPTNLSWWDAGNAGFAETWIPAQTEWLTTRTILLTIQAWATTDSLIASGWYFTINFVVAWGASGDTIKLYRSSDGSTWTANTPDASCTLTSSLVCGFRTDHLSYFASIKETITSWGWGNWWWGGWWAMTPSCTTTQLICTGWKYILLSWADCTSIKIGLACTLTGSMLTSGTILSWAKTGKITRSTFSTELNQAYLYAFNIGITTMTTIEKADMTGSLQRNHLAKMISNFVIKQLGKTPNTWMVCNFMDMQNESTEMKFYSRLACQLGLMGVGVTNFDPKGEVTRAQFGTVLSRALWGNVYNGGTPYYLPHLQALQHTGIMNDISMPTMNELRGYVMLMLMRSVK